MVTAVVGLRDGIHTAGTAAMLRKLSELGVTATVAKTGRVVVRLTSGERRVYALKLDMSVDPETCNSPLKQAMADLAAR